MSERTIFLTALEFTNPNDRAAYLDAACEGNPALRREVEALLRSHDSAGSFLETPAQPGSSSDTPTQFLSAQSQQPPETPDAVAAVLELLAPSDRPDARGRIGHYDVLEVLGHGAFGVVLRAFDSKLHRIVAIKAMNPEMAATSPPRKRFLREARSAAAVKHEHIVSIYSVEEEPLPYLVMEYVSGKTLQTWLDEHGPLEPLEVVQFGRQIAAGLAAAHAQGLIHRDIKPANILLESGLETRAKITDFGLARAADDASLTQSGLIAGTPLYMAPEQAKGQPLDGRADLFSLGSVLYTMLSGRPPFRAPNTIAVLRRVCEDTPRAIGEVIPGTPPWLCDIIAKLHAKEPADRFQSATEVVQALDAGLAYLKDPQRAPQPAVKVPVSASPTPAATPHVKSSSPSKWLIAAVIAVCLLPLGGCLLGILALALPAWQLAASRVAPLPASSITAGLQFDGRDDYVRVADLGWSYPQFTLEAFVTSATDGDNGVIAMLHQGGAAPDQETMFLFDGPASSLERHSGAGIRGQAPYDNVITPLSTGERQHRALVYDGNVMHYFVNGRWKGKRYNDANVGMQWRMHELLIGCKPTQTEFFRGRIDQLRVSRVARYVADFPLMSTLDSDDTTLALYHFDEGQGTQLRDKSGHGHHGTIHGATWVHPTSGSSSSPIPAPLTDTWQPLFNGRDLTGWQPNDQWKVENGVLVSRVPKNASSPPSMLVTERNDYRDFHVRLEAKLNHGGDSGFFFRFGDQGKSALQAQLTAGPTPLGSILSGPDTIAVSDRTIPHDVWFTLEVIAKGPEVAVSINGQPAVLLRNHADRGEAGPFAIESGFAGTEVMIRKLEVRAPAVREPAPTKLTPSVPVPSPYDILTTPDYEWTPPENLGPTVNTPVGEKFAALTGDGLRLVFFSHGRAETGLSEATRTRIDEPFGVVQPLGAEFSHNSVHAGIALTGDGLLLVFGSARPGGPGEPGTMNLWQATRPDLSTPFAKPVCLMTLNTEGDDVNPCLSADGLTIRYQSPRSGRNFWMSRRPSRDAEFPAPTPVDLPLLPGVLSYSHLPGQTLSSDERVLIFAPAYHDQVANKGVQKLVMSVRPTRDAPFGTPVDLGPVVNSDYGDQYPTLSADGSVMIFESARPGSLGVHPDGDLWMTRRVRKTTAVAGPSVPAIDLLTHPLVQQFAHTGKGLRLENGALLVTSAEADGLAQVWIDKLKTRRGRVRAVLQAMDPLPQGVVSVGWDYAGGNPRRVDAVLHAPQGTPTASVWEFGPNFNVTPLVDETIAVDLSQPIVIEHEFHDGTVRATIAGRTVTAKLSANSDRKAFPYLGVKGTWKLTEWRMEDLEGAEPIQPPSPPGIDDVAERRAAEWVMANAPQGRLIIMTTTDKKRIVLTGAQPLPMEPFVILRADLIRPEQNLDDGLSKLAVCPKLAGMHLDLTDGISAGTLVALRQFTNLEELQLVGGGRKIPGLDEALATTITRLPKLRQLEVKYLSSLSDRMVESLAALPELRSFKMDGTSLSDAGLERLGSIAPHLEELEYGYETRTSLLTAAKFPKLTTLLTPGAKVTEAGVAALGGLPDLRKLGLSHDCDAALARLLPLAPKLEELELNAPRISPAGYAALRQFTRLELLMLNSGSQSPTDEDLLAFAAWPRLKRISLRDFPAVANEHQLARLWTDAGLAAFRLKRPDVRLEIDGQAVPVAPPVGWQNWPADAPPPAIAPFDAAAATAHQEAWAKHLGVPVEYTNSIGMKFRLIPPGEFLMGSTPEEIAADLKDANPNDKHWQECLQSQAPQHQVILTQPIYLGVNEVTQTEYEKVMGSNPSHFGPMGMGKEAVAGLETAEHPVEMVSWNDAAEFCAKLSKQEQLKPFYFRAGETITPLDGTGYRLPSEAEWEFACRAGTVTKYWIGDQEEDLVRAGWFGGKYGRRTHAAGELKANPFGLFDIHGNIWEWVQDGFDKNYYGQFQGKPAINPNSPFSDGSERVFRGGHWKDPASYCRSSYHYAAFPTGHYDYIGFRVSLPVEAVRESLKQAAPPAWQSWPADAPAPAISPFDAAAATAHQEAWAKHLGVPVEYTNSIGMKFRLIPPGEFTMGSTPEEIEAILKETDVKATYWRDIYQSEAPRHKVILTRPYYLGVKEVTQAEYRHIMGTNPSHFASTGQRQDRVAGLETADFPVDAVSWNNAAEFCVKLSEQERLQPFYQRVGEVIAPLEGTGYRLPSEAEWEFACRGGTTTKYWFGDVDAGLLGAGWYSENAQSRTHKAGEFRANPFGLFDMHGNVWEWVQDAWTATDYGQFTERPAIDPQKPGEPNSSRILRGGSWNSYPSFLCLSSRRHALDPRFPDETLGFRVALPIEAVQESLKPAPPRATTARSAWQGWPADAPSPAIAPFDAAQAKAHQEAWAKHLGVPVEYTNSIGMKFRLIPPGEFLMGSTPEEIETALKEIDGDQHWQECLRSGAPRHKVRLTQAIYLGVNEVTQAEYARLMGLNPSEFHANGAEKDAVVGLDTTNHPVESVTWNDAAEFCAELSRRETLKPFYLRAGGTITPLEGTGYRLPTEAEWEFACRAGTTTRFWSGDADESLVGVGWSGAAAGGRTHAVGELKPNPFGLFDVHGNVWEWVQDGWDASQYRQFPDQAAIDPSRLFIDRPMRSLRGGRWGNYPAAFCRSSFRHARDPSHQGHDIGFRVALTVEAVRASLAGKVSGNQPQSLIAPEPQRLELSWIEPEYAALNRRAAEAALNAGGSVQGQVIDPTNGRFMQDFGVNSATALPVEPFILKSWHLKRAHPGAKAAFAAVAGLRHLDELVFHATTARGVELSHLREARSLWNFGITTADWQISRLVELTNRSALRVLWLHARSVDDEGASLAGCSALRVIWCDNSDAAINLLGLATAPGLRYIFLTKPVTEEAVAAVQAAHPRLQIVVAEPSGMRVAGIDRARAAMIRLYERGWPIMAAGGDWAFQPITDRLQLDDPRWFQWICGQQPPVELEPTEQDWEDVGYFQPGGLWRLRGHQHADAMARGLAAHVCCLNLDLSNSTLTDEGLAALQSLTALRTLYVTGCPVSEAAIQAFHRAHPEILLATSHGNYGFRFRGAAADEAGASRPDESLPRAKPSP